MKNTLQQHWESFSKIVIPEQASLIQVIEMKRAFYAGAQSFNAAQHNATNKNISENAGIEILKGLEDELIRFAIEVENGNE
jgi:hypothetical protein